jgi:hypothetical protein
MTYVDRFATIEEHSPKVWGNGQWRDTDEHYDNGVQPTKIVRTAMGFHYEGTHNHRMRVAREGRIQWVRTDEMVVGDRILIDRSVRWHTAPENVEPIEAYALGLMIGDGSYHKSTHLRFATIDEELIHPLNMGTGMRFRQCGDVVHWNAYGKEDIVDWREYWGLKPVKTIDKVLPPKMLAASRKAMSACIRGIFDTDGTLQVSTEKGGTSVGVSLTNTSRRLIEQIHYILLHYGIVGRLSSRDRSEKWNRVYELLITGKDVVTFYEQIGFGLSRKSKLLESGLEAKLRFMSNGDGVPFVKDAMWKVSSENRIRRGFATKASGMVSASKIKKRKLITHDMVSYFLEVYGHIRSDEVDLVKSLGNPDVYYDEIVSIEDSRCHTFDIHVPDGHEYCAGGFFSHNTKIRGQRAHDILADEHASIPWEIYETVVRGFGVVELEPVEKVKRKAEIRVLKKEGLWTEQMADNERSRVIGNQSVISGTGYYQFNHLYEYWKRYKATVESRGDPKLLQAVYPNGVDDKFDYRDYSVIRLPVDLLPEGFMDEKQVAHSRQNHNLSVFLNEFGACFASDSNGFFKRSLIESCVTKDPIVIDGERVQFRATNRGLPDGHYVYGIDPASEHDRFSIVILEVHPSHRRIVYCWTTTRAEYQNRIKAGLCKEYDFYGFCARKIRELMRIFPCEHIAMDSQGGGVAVAEALHDPDKMEKGDKPIWPIASDHPLSDGKERDSDAYEGLHILELVSFARSEWVSEANHGMRKDFEDHVLLFPEYDTALLAVAMEEDQNAGRIYDTLEDAVAEVEEIKEELATIVHTQTSTSFRDRWDTPEIKLPGSRKGRLRKDRYSALLMANMAARRLNRQFTGPDYAAHGGFVNGEFYAPQGQPGNRMYVSGPDWFVRGVEGDMHGYGWVVRDDGVPG